MTRRPPRVSAPPRGRHLRPLLLIVAACSLAYANCYRVPFVCDDIGGIVENPTIRTLWPLTQVLSTPRWGNTLHARPIANLTLALNYHAHGLDVIGYHVTNLAIHVLAAFTLYGLIRRTLWASAPRWALRPHASPLALTMTLLWALHPLHTQVVTYVVQRVESLMALFYLLTLYAVARHADLDGTPPTASSRQRRTWTLLSILACALGMGSKEVMVSAPVVALLFDRIFLAGSWRAVWKQRLLLHMGLFATWGVLLALQLTVGGFRNVNTGFGGHTSPWHYLLTQSEVLIHYLRLSVWPAPLVFDYRDWALARSLTEVWPSALAVSAACVWAVASTLRASALGFLVFCSFAILAPTSSIMPVDDLVQERRMYLPLVPVVVALVMLVYRRFAKSPAPDSLHTDLSNGQVHAARLKLLLALSVITTIALGVGTFRRNQDYRSELILWMDALEKRPNNAQAAVTAGAALLDMGKLEPARALFERAIRLKPDYAMAYNNLGLVYHRQGDLASALAAYEQGLRFPGLPAHSLHNNKGITLQALGRTNEALQAFSEAIAVVPVYAKAYHNRANLRTKLGEIDAALTDFAHAVQYSPESPGTYRDRANLLAAQGRYAEALRDLDHAITLGLHDATGFYNRANVRAQLGDLPGALDDFDAAIRLKPDFGHAYNNRASVRYLVGRIREAASDLDTCRAIGFAPNPELVRLVSEARAAGE